MGMKKEVKNWLDSAQYDLEAAEGMFDRKVYLYNFHVPFSHGKDIESEKYKTILSDWQGWNIGVGGLDLAYMIGLMLFPDYRHLIEKDLIKRYHSHLIKLGIKNYSWDNCWYDYKLFTFFNIYTCIWWWNMGTVSSSFFWAKLETSLSTLEDLNCMELLESK